MENQSILSYSNPIQAWLDIQDGALILGEKFGNNLHEMLFLNKQQLALSTSKILDKLTLDFGEQVANLVDEVQVLTHEGIDKYILAIRYNNTQLAYKVIGV